jgi:hypothetical protein
VVKYYAARVGYRDVIRGLCISASWGQLDTSVEVVKALLLPGVERCATFASWRRLDTSVEVGKGLLFPEVERYATPAQAILEQACRGGNLALVQAILKILYPKVPGRATQEIMRGGAYYSGSREILALLPAKRGGDYQELIRPAVAGGHPEMLDDIFDAKFLPASLVTKLAAGYGQLDLLVQYLDGEHVEMLCHAIHGNKLNTFQYLADQLTEEIFHIMTMAISYGRVEMVKYLVQKGWSISREQRQIARVADPFSGPAAQLMDREGFRNPTILGDEVGEHDTYLHGYWDATNDLVGMAAYLREQD